ncbi:MAG: Gfo/Idh/MocA family oxidoreductase [bacterium]|nr:Gfo/Idh/MocA family oxidoreductase [bacterium]
MGRKSRSDKVRVGVIGLGVGQHHIWGYQKCPKAEVVAVCDVDASRAQQVATKENIARWFTDYRKLLELRDIDAVSICTPNYLHRPVAELAFAAGKHVLCEKPLSINAKEGAKIVLAAKKAKRKLMIAYCNRFRGESQVLKQFIDAGELGDIYYAKCGWLRRRGIPGIGGWFTTKSQSGGGPLIDLGVHVLDLTLWLMGFPAVESVIGSVYTHFGNKNIGFWWRGGTAPFDVEDLASAFIKLKNGATLTLDASWASNIEKSDEFYSRLMGTKGGAELDPLIIYKEEHGIQVDVKPACPKVDGFAAETTHFIDCIVNDREPIATGEQGLAVMQILDAIYQSAKTGKQICINENNQ